MTAASFSGTSLAKASWNTSGSMRNCFSSPFAAPVKNRLPADQIDANGKPTVFGEQSVESAALTVVDSPRKFLLKACGLRVAGLADQLVLPVLLCHGLRVTPSVGGWRGGLVTCCWSGGDLVGRSLRDAGERECCRR